MEITTIRALELRDMSIDEVIRTDEFCDYMAIETGKTEKILIGIKLWHVKTFQIRLAALIYGEKDNNAIHTFPPYLNDRR